MIGVKDGGSNGHSHPPMEAEDPRRQKVIAEILQTEADYVRDLRTIVEVRFSTPPHNNFITHHSSNLSLALSL